MKFKYLLDGLDCAHCAEKIQAELLRLDYVQSVVVTFADRKLRAELQAEDEARFLRDAQAIVNKHEQNCIIKDENAAISYTECSSDACTVKGSKKTVKFPIKAYDIIGIFAILIFILSLFFPQGTLKSFWGIVAYGALVYPIFLISLKNLKSGDIFDEHFLMLIASVGAMLLGLTEEAIEVVALFRVGAYLEDLAVERSRRSITSLVSMRPDKARVKINDTWEDRKPEQIQIGDVIQIRTGERVPLDGTILSGEGVLDKAAITGESKPEFIEKGNEIISGSVLINGLLEVSVSRAFGQSTVSRILEMVENAPANKANSERLISRFAKVYTPIVLGLAVIVAFIVPLILNDYSHLKDWLARSLIFLVISCPCAIVISVPLCYFAGIGIAAKKGILFKGAYVLEQLRKCNAAVFDKTGTLTDGSLKLLEVKPETGFEADEIISLAAALERNSNHPIAKAITLASAKELAAADYNETAGKGVSGVVEGRSVLVGSLRFLEEKGVPVINYEGKFAAQYVAVDNCFAGVMLLQDTVKKDAAKAFAELRSRGINRLSILSGDQKHAVEKVAREVGADEAAYELLPEQKVEQLSKISGNATVIYTGDGINDAPVLVRADVGVSMGQLGSDIAIEASDIVLMRDDLSLLPKAIDIARSVKNRVVEGLSFALGVKAIVMLLGILGIATAWMAVFADTGVTIICVLNALRVRVK